MNYILNLDIRLFYFFNQKIANGFFDWLMPIITTKQNWIIPILILWLALLIFGTKKTRIAAILLFITVGTTDPVCYRLLKPTFKRLRPSHALEDVRLLVRKGGKYGFPSNHAANITAAMAVLSYFLRKYRYAFSSVALLVSFSRIYVGVHYPLDVLFGMGIGLFFAFLWITIWLLTANRLSKRGISLLSITANHTE